MPIETMEITKQMIDDFRTATQDTNKIHQGEKAIALGFQIASIMGSYAKTLFSDSVFDWTSQITNFEKVIGAGAKVTLDADLTGQEYENHEITVKLMDSRGNVLAVSALKYGPGRTPERTAPEGHYYPITFEDAAKTARGIGKDGTDISALVRGLASNALYEDGTEIIQIAATEKDLVPVYIRHQITPSTAERQLRIGSGFYIATNGPTIAKRIKSDLAMGKDFGRRIYTTQAHAITEDGQQIYEAELKLVLMPKTEFERRIIT